MEVPLVCDEKGDLVVKNQSAAERYLTASRFVTYAGHRLIEQPQMFGSPIMAEPVFVLGTPIMPEWFITVTRLLP